MLLLVSSILPSPHQAEEHRGLWEGHLAQISMGPGNWIFLPIRTVGYGGGWSLGLSRISLFLLHPFSNRLDLMVMMERKEPHGNQEAWVWLCCGQGRYQGVDSLGLRRQDIEPEYPLQYSSLMGHYSLTLHFLIN